MKIIDLSKEDKNKIKNRSDKNVKKYNLGISNNANNTNNMNKKNLKSNKYMHNFGKMIEIDISNLNSNDNINQIRTFIESKNPFITEHSKNKSFVTNISKEKEISKDKNNNNNKFRLSAKVINNEFIIFGA